MAKRRKWIGLAVVLALLCGICVMLNTNGHKASKKSPGTVDVGVLDLNKAMREHPQYQAWRELKKQEKQLNFLQEGQAGTGVPKLSAGGGLQLDAVTRQQREQKLKERQRESNQRLKTREQEVRGKYAKKHRAEEQTIEDEFAPQIFNLQLKLDTLKMTREAAQAIQDRIDVLKIEENKKKYALQEKYLRLIAADMAAVKQQEQKKLADYTATLDAELAGKSSRTAAILNKRNAALLDGVKPFAPAAADRQKLRTAADKLEMKIMDDIKEAAAKIARKKQLAVVLADVSVNVQAVDVTAEVIAYIKK